MIPEIIVNNPYRVLGLCAGASHRDIVRNYNKIHTHNMVGRALAFEYDLENLLPAPQRDAAAVTEALAKLERTDDRILYALFWLPNFVKKHALWLEYLKEGDTKAAESSLVGHTDHDAWIYRAIIAFSTGREQDGYAHLVKVVSTPELNAEFIAEFTPEDEVAQITPIDLMRHIAGSLTERTPRSAEDFFARLKEYPQFCQILLEAYTAPYLRDIEDAISLADASCADDHLQAAVGILEKTANDVRELKPFLNRDTNAAFAVNNWLKEIVVVHLAVYYQQNGSKDILARISDQQFEMLLSFSTDINVSYWIVTIRSGNLKELCPQEVSELEQIYERVNSSWNLNEVEVAVAQTQAVLKKIEPYGPEAEKLCVTFDVGLPLAGAVMRIMYSDANFINRANHGKAALLLDTIASKIPLKPQTKIDILQPIKVFKENNVTIIPTGWLLARIAWGILMLGIMFL